MTNVAGSSETSVIFCQAAGRYVPEDSNINLLEPELFFLILAYPVYKMWIIQEPNTL